jgi:hypothetical protein
MVLKARYRSQEPPTLAPTPIRHAEEAPGVGIERQQQIHPHVGRREAATMVLRHDAKAELLTLVTLEAHVGEFPELEFAVWSADPEAL